MPSTRDPWTFYLVEPRLLYWVEYRGRGRSCECRLWAEAVAPGELPRRDGEPPRFRVRRNVSRTGFNHSGHGRAYCSHLVGRRTVFSTVPIGCRNLADRYTEDDRGIRWWFCEDCAPPVIGTEWYRTVMDPQSMSWPFWVDEHCWNCICHCSECHDGGF